MSYNLNMHFTGVEYVLKYHSLSLQSLPFSRIFLVETAKQQVLASR